MGIASVGSLVLLLFCVTAIANVTGQSLSGLKVSGNKIVNAEGETVRLRGVDRSGTEFACIQGWGIFDGPNDLESIQAIASWNTNAVRLPLNEDCWLNINGVNPSYGGTNYQNAIYDFVQLLNSQNFAVILDLHWTAPGSTPATGQQPMPDTDHSIMFWQQVAKQYANNSMVLFDLFNEPYPDNNNWNSEAGWQCWLYGGNNCSGVPYDAAGMQDLVNAVRGAGAPNILLLGGLAYSNSLAQWLQYMPNDPLGNLAASWHSYNFNYCNQQSCWEEYVLPVAQKVPVVATEIGENDCASGYITPLMNWMDGIGASYLAWTWDTWDCNSGPSLISNYSGTPTSYGQGYYEHLTGKKLYA